MSLKRKAEKLLESVSGKLNLPEDLQEFLPKSKPVKAEGKNDRVEFEKKFATIKRINKNTKEILDIDEQNEIINPQIGKLNFALKECFIAWKSKKQMADRYDEAILVLQAYYNETKIRDFLEKMREVIDEAENTDDLKRGYNSYLVFAKNDFESLCKKREYQSDASKSYEIKSSLKNICWFIDNECRSITLLKNLFELTKKTGNLGNSMNGHIDEKKYTLSYSENILYSSVTTDWEVLQRTLKTESSEAKSIIDEAVEELSKLKAGFVEQQKNLKSEIDKANALYQALKDNLTDELFNAFDPKCENDPLPLTELRDLYENRVGKNILDKYVNRFEEE